MGRNKTRTEKHLGLLTDGQVCQRPGCAARLTLSAASGMRFLESHGRDRRG